MVHYVEKNSKFGLAFQWLHLMAMYRKREVVVEICLPLLLRLLCFQVESFRLQNS